jgi:opacity protein-like surface antigen
MRRTSFGLVAVIAAASMSFADRAMAEQGYYLELHGGGVILEDSDMSASNNLSGSVEFDTGYLIGGAFGYAWEQGWRAEVALDYRDNDIDDSNVTGDMATLAGMLNGFYQLPIDFPVKPYVGAGVGWARVDLEAKVSGSEVVDDDDLVFAYQAMAGVTYEINPAIAIGAGYVYFATDDPNFHTKNGGRGFDSEYASHNLMIQLRISTYPSGAF